MSFDIINILCDSLRAFYLKALFFNKLVNITLVMPNKNKRLIIMIENVLIKIGGFLIVFSFAVLMAYVLIEFMLLGC